MVNKFDMKDLSTAWCPGCGNFGIQNVLKQALEELNFEPEKTVLVSGIGQAAKMPQYVKTNFFNGLHGRALGPATAIKAANPELNVIVTSGDGDMYGEGGNHFMHTIRRNPNITVLVHDNMIYGLTKGQASPTSKKGLVTPVQTLGVELTPFNPIATAISLDAAFVARASISDMKHTKEIIKQAIEFEGFAIVDIFQPCVTFNKLNTYDWFKENTYKLDESYDPTNRVEAFVKSVETEKFPLGVIYVNKAKTFNEMTGVFDEDKSPLYKRPFNLAKLKELIGKPKAMRSFDGKIVEIIQETKDVKTFVVERPKGFSYKAGQYAMIGLPGDVKIDGKQNIPITFSSSPTEEHVKFTIKEMFGYTKEFFKLNVGDELNVKGPMGKTFNTTEGTQDNFVFLSGGTGITPFLSMMRYIVDKEMPNKVVMLNGNKKYEDIICREELDYFSTRENIFVMNTLDECNPDWKGEEGFICEEMIKKYVDDVKDYTYCLCGPPVMTKSAVKILKGLGVSESKIKFDEWELPNKNK